MRHINSKNIFVAVIVLAFVTVFGVSSSQAQATVFEANTDAPFTGPVQACTETVDFTGNLHVVVHFSIKPNGNFQQTILVNYQDAQGVGEITGSDYRLTGVAEKFSFTSSQPQFEFTFVTDSHVVSQGPGDNYRLSSFMHVTVDANGQVTANVTHTMNTCH